MLRQSVKNSGALKLVYDNYNLQHSINGDAHKQRTAAFYIEGKYYELRARYKSGQAAMVTAHPHYVFSGNEVWTCRIHPDVLV